MYVYLKRGKLIKRFRNVLLCDCYQPKVDGVSVEKIEPALWFKVLFLDSLFVDCDGRDVFWNKDTCVDAENIHKTEDHELKLDTVLPFFRSKGRIFEEEGCYDFDIFVDELFDTARSIVDELEYYDRKNDPKGLDNTKQKLLRLLHVFILPTLKLRESELTNLQTILSWIEHQHQSVEIKITKKDKTKYNVENSLREQRKRLLQHEDFGSQKYVASCDSEFLETFLKHLLKDITSMNTKLLEYDKEIMPLRNSKDREALQRLGNRRADRDRTLAFIDKAIEARETIKNVIGRPHVLKKTKPSRRQENQTFHVLYVQIAQRIQEMNKEIQDLIKSKIQISSVREAALLAIVEITENGESYGFERKAGSFEFETDIYDPNNKPEEWATLSEKIADLLKAKPLGYRDCHEKFCERIRLRCQSLLDDSKLFTAFNSPTEDSTSPDLNTLIPLSPSTAQVLDLLGRESVNRRSTRSGISSFTGSQEEALRSTVKSRSYSTRFSFGSIPREATESLCKEIISHISDMAENLAKELYQQALPKIYRTTINKIYICYESHISTELMPVLQDLYEQSYRKQCEGLSRWISSISLSDIGFDDRKFEILVSPPVVKEPVTGGVMPDPTSSEETEVKVPFVEDEDRFSIEQLEKLSFDELYKFSNAQLTSRETHFSCAPGMEGWVELNSESENYSNNEIDIDDEKNYHDTVFRSESDDVEKNVVEMEVIEACEHDPLMAVEPSVSHENDQMNAAENLITTLASTRRKIKTCTETKDEISDRLTADHEKRVETRIPVIVNEPPLYEEVVMRRRSPPPEYEEEPPAKARFYKKFEKFETILSKETEAVSLFKKLRVMTKAIQYIEKEISKLRNDGQTNVMVCTDDILDIVILLLSRLDSDTLLKVYSHMNLMIHLSPRFMHGNAHDYALVTFNVAYQHLFEQHVLHKSHRF